MARASGRAHDKITFLSPGETTTRMASAAVQILPTQWRRVGSALLLSLLLHAGILTAWRFHVFTPPQLGQIKALEVELVADTAPRGAEPSRPKRADAARQPLSPSAPVPRPTAASDQPSSPVASETTTEQPLIEARSDVASLNNPKPPYPLAARRRGMEGTTLLSVHVLSNGNPTDIRIKQSSGHSLLDNVALDTVRQWRFVPAQRGNTAVDSWVDVPVRFRMQTP